MTIDWRVSGGKLLVLYGGASKSPVHESVGSEVAVLNVDTSTWDKPSTARTMALLHGHTATVTGRTKMISFGGVKGDATSADVSVFNTDTMKFVDVIKVVMRLGIATTQAYLQF